jgi:hypothetical protein
LTITHPNIDPKTKNCTNHQTTQHHNKITQGRSQITYRANSKERTGRRRGIIVPRLSGCCPRTTTTAGRSSGPLPPARRARASSTARNPSIAAGSSRCQATNLLCSWTLPRSSPVQRDEGQKRLASCDRSQFNYLRYARSGTRSRI